MPPRDDDPDAHPELWDFDELRRQPLEWVRRRHGDALHTSYLNRSLAYQRLHTAVTDLAGLTGTALAEDPQLAAAGAADWLAPGPYALHPSTLPLLTAAAATPWQYIRLGLQIRWGQFFTRARAHRIYPAQHPDPTCGLCGAGCRETIAHYFGGCGHPVTHGLRCNRHGDSIMALVRAIRAGDCGTRPLFHDSERGDRTARALPPPSPTWTTTAPPI